MINIPQNSCKSITISRQGYQRAVKQGKSEPKYAGQHFIWTDDPSRQLPIRLGTSHPENIPPTTVIDQWKISLLKFGKLPALSVKRANQWVTTTYEQYYRECIKFAKSLLSLGLKQFSTVNIIGFNSPEWHISYFGSIFAKAIPVGIYSTNSKDMCQYIVSHSESRIVIAQNRSYAEKYYDLLTKGEIDLIVIYGEESVKDASKMLGWGDFLDLGKTISDAALEEKMSRIYPGNCCSIIYTSGTTGKPKGVMASHDNFTWNIKAASITLASAFRQEQRIISYLPLSHSAAQFGDLCSAVVNGHHVFFAQPTALQGTLFQTVKEVKPQRFFTVPRIWEKIYEVIRQFTKKCGPAFEKLGNNVAISDERARLIGEEETLRQEKGLPVSAEFLQAKQKVFNKYKQILGLNQCNLFTFGAAPLDPAIRKYLLSVNIFLRNGYGMTESTAPSFYSNHLKVSFQKPQDYLQIGYPLVGTQAKIQKTSQEDEDGELCMRGRHIFMGYLKNAEETAKTIDNQGFLHSGDIGKLNKGNAFFLTGRIKQLIITAGGENIPPIIIQNQIRSTLPCLSNVMVVGDKRNYLTCLISLKKEADNVNIEKSVIHFLESNGCKCKKIGQLATCSQFRKIILDGLKNANKKATSRAQNVHNFYLMPEDFSVQNGALTPTLKLRRNEVLKKYSVQIDEMYMKANL